MFSERASVFGGTLKSTQPPAGHSYFLNLIMAGPGRIFFFYLIKNKRYTQQCTPTYARQRPGQRFPDLLFGSPSNFLLLRHTV
ncbi:uncharacterized protein PG998_001443 [Apiospora kogelbergensis]|uniref:uncharacterized protein n=1 Tax=Apiospora kogelbergensis TaxID=1337665 RepID=UPI00313293C1